MATKKNFGEKLSQVMKKATEPKKLVLLHIPEYAETAPHWLFWLLIVSLLALAIAILVTRMSASPLLQTYIPL